MRNKSYPTKMFRWLIPGIILIVVLVSLTAIAAVHAEATLPHTVAPVSQQDVNTWDWFPLTTQHQIGERLLHDASIPVSSYDFDIWAWRFVTNRHPITDQFVPNAAAPVSQHDADMWETIFWREWAAQQQIAEQHVAATWEAKTNFWREWTAEQHVAATWEAKANFWRN